MKTIEEMVEVMNHFANGGEVEFYSTEYEMWNVLTNPVWAWDDCDYHKKEHTYKVGDWVEVVGSHCPSRVGDVVQITEIDSVGDIWAEGWIIENDPDQHASDDVCKIKPASKPEPTYKPFTAETFPKGVVWIRENDWMQDVGLRSMITTINRYAVHYDQNSYMSFEDAVKLAEISLDGGETWQKAGRK